MSQHTSTSRVGYGSRLKSSFSGVLIGILLFIAAFPVLFINEVKRAQTAKTLRQEIENVIEVEPAPIEDKHNGALVHLIGDTVTDDMLSNIYFRVRVQDALALRSVVEMYQWREETSTQTKDNIGGSQDVTTTYDYEEVWSSSHIDSDNFEYRDTYVNPDAIPLEAETMRALNVFVGDRQLSGPMIQMMDDFEALSLADQDLVLQGYEPIDDETLYRGNDYSNPEIGDMRVRFEYVPTGTYSFIASQDGDMLGTYITKKGKELVMVERGQFTADELFAQAAKSNRALGWILRLVGFFMMLIGLNLIMGPLTTLTAVLPFLKRIVGGLTGFAMFLAALALSLVTISIAWLIARPLIGILMLAIVGALIYGIRRMRQKDSSVATVTTAATSGPVVDTQATEQGDEGIVQE